MKAGVGTFLLQLLQSMQLVAQGVTVPNMLGNISGSRVHLPDYSRILGCLVQQQIQFMRQFSVAWWYPTSNPEVDVFLVSPEKYKKLYSHWEKSSGIFSVPLAHTWFDRGFMRQFAEAGGISHIFYVKEDSVFEPCVSGSRRLVSSLPEVYRYFGLSGTQCFRIGAA